MSTTVSPTLITVHELEQIERVNATTATPVVFGPPVRRRHRERPTLFLVEMQ